MIAHASVLTHKRLLILALTAQAHFTTELRSKIKNWLLLS